MTPTDPKNWMKAEAERLGFCFIGFTTPDPIPEALDHLSAWLAEGFAGDQAYLSRADVLAKKRDPRLLLADVRSVVVLGVRIPTVDRSSQKYLVADFAHFADYHHTIAAAVEKLIAAFTAQFGSSSQWRVCVDSSPILERAYAVKAGLGWIGKSSMLIHPAVGSRTLLCAALTTAEFQPDEPFSGEYCGSCSRCVDACPTGCIDGGKRWIDASRCVSYLTIERKLALDPELAPKIGSRVFGCDVCTDVCPWNRRAASHPQQGGLLAEVPTPLPDDFDLTLTPEAFKKKYASSPILRRKLPRWVENLNNAAMCLKERSSHDEESELNRFG